MSALLRILFLLAIAWFIWSTLRRWIIGVETRAKTAAAQQRQQQRPLAGGKVVKCRYCEVHLPEREALRQNEEWFCNAEHARLYLTKR
jgi:uncharacterized protein